VGEEEIPEGVGINVMYSIFGPTKMLRILTKILQDHGFVVRQTKLKEYILVRRNPRRYIPDNILKAVKITEFEGDYYDFLRDANLIRDLLAPVKFRAGDPVLIVDGPYKDFNGIIKEEKPDKTLASGEKSSPHPLKPITLQKG
jgi:hypothetical protein